jgi:hypothetical protein
VRPDENLRVTQASEFHMLVREHIFVRCVTRCDSLQWLDESVRLLLAYDDHLHVAVTKYHVYRDHLRTPYTAPPLLVKQGKSLTASTRVY